MMTYASRYYALSTKCARYFYFYPQKIVKCWNIIFIAFLFSSFNLALTFAFGAHERRANFLQIPRRTPRDQGVDSIGNGWQLARGGRINPIKELSQGKTWWLENAAGVSEVMAMAYPSRWTSASH